MVPETRRAQQAGRLAPHRRYLPVARGEASGSPRMAHGLYPGEPETCRRNLRQFVPILAHYGLLVGVFSVYRVEGRAFQILAATALAALPIHYALPLRRK